MSEYKEVKTLIDEKMSYCSEYRGNSIGRGIHYIYVICGLRYSEDSIWGEKEVKMYGELFATVNWDNGYPLFDFVNDIWNERQKELLVNG